MALLECLTCGGKLKTEKDSFIAKCEYCGNEMTIFESTAEFEIDARGILVQYNGKGGDVVVPDDVRKIGPACFRDNERIFSIKLPDSIEEIGAKAFRGCTELEEINLPDSLQSIGEQAFTDCTSLREITIPAGVLSIKEFLFVDCHSLHTVVLPDSIRTIEKSAFIDCKKLKKINLPAKLRKLGDFALEGCLSLQELTLPDTLREIGEAAFRRCESLTQLHLPDSVESIGMNVFSGCSGLKQVTLSKELTYIPVAAFQGCSSLEKLVIPENVTKIDDGAFWDCTSLKSIQLPAGIREIHTRAFRGANNLEGVLDIPAGVLSVDFALMISKITHLKIGKAIENLDSMGYHFPLLEKVTIYEGTQMIPKNIFRNCHSLKTVEFPSTLETIGSHAFIGCTALQDVDLPSVQTIGKSAFMGCRALHTVRIGEGCLEIAADAFCSSECNKRTFYLPGSIQSIGDEALHTISSTIHSPNNTAIRNYCNRDSSCRWVYQPTAAELQQQELARQRKARQEEIERLETYKNSEQIRLNQAKDMLQFHRQELAEAQSRIQPLEAQLPKLTGVFSRKKRQECEEKLEMYRKRVLRYQQEIKVDEAEVAKRENTVRYYTEKIAALK